METILIIVGAVIVGAAVFFVVWRAKGRSGASGAGVAPTVAQTPAASPAEDRAAAEREAAAAAERAAAERAAAERAAAERAAAERAAAERAAAERAAAERAAAERAAAAAEAERRGALQRASAEAASQASAQIPAPREVRTLDPAGPKPLPSRYRRTPEPEEPTLAPRGAALPRRVANQVPQETSEAPVKPVPTGESRGRIGDFRPRGR